MHCVNVVVLLACLVLVTEPLNDISSIIKLVPHKVTLPVIELGEVFVMVYIVLGVQLVETLQALFEKESDGGVVSNHEARHPMCALHIWRLF